MPVGHGQVRRAWVVVGCLGYSRAGADALIFSKEAPDVLWGMARCLWSFGALAQLLVWDREGALHAGGGRPTDVYAAFCGQLPVDWYFCEAKDPQAKGAVERLQGYLESNLSRGAPSLTTWTSSLSSTRGLRRSTRARTRRSGPGRSTVSLKERGAMRALPAQRSDVDRRWVTRVPPDPHVRFDTNDYSLDPGLVGRRVEVRAGQREITALALDSGELACRHERSFAKHRTIVALEHARALRERRGEPDGEPLVQKRPLAVYDRLIA